MSYRTNKQITMIDDLPFLDELENPRSNGLTMIPTDNMPTVQKFIRNNNYNPPVESGMSNQPSPNIHQQQHNNHQQEQYQQYQQHQHQHQQQHQQQKHNQESFEHEMFNDPRIFMSQFQEPQEQTHTHRFFHNPNEPSCIVVAEHTTNCIVCSKLYQNNTTGYIIVIIILAIISILLLKRVLNV